MGRPLRSIEPGTVYHVISRFVGQEWFVRGAVERRGYLDLLGMYLGRSDWRCFSFAVMSNHIHLGVVAGTDSLASWMRPAHTAFAQWINERRERIGAVFVRGPKAIAVRNEGAARLIGYIHRNPVRAGVVATAAESDWTSHRAYLGLTERPSWLDADCGLQLAGFRNARELDAWTNDAAPEREDLDEVRVVPRRKPGRPRRQDSEGASPIALRLEQIELPRAGAAEGQLHPLPAAGFAERQQRAVPAGAAAGEQRLWRADLVDLVLECASASAMPPRTTTAEGQQRAASAGAPKMQRRPAPAGAADVEPRLLREAVGEQRPALSGATEEGEQRLRHPNAPRPPIHRTYVIAPPVPKRLAVLSWQRRAPAGPHPWLIEHRAPPALRQRQGHEHASSVEESLAEPSRSRRISPSEATEHRRVTSMSQAAGRIARRSLRLQRIEAMHRIRAPTRP